MRLSIWFEHNFNIPSLEQEIITGLLDLKSLIDDCYISTTPNQNFAMFSRIASATGMKIIPGLKTAPLLPRLDDYFGWKAIALKVAEIINLIGCSEFILENETAAKHFIEGTNEVDLGYMLRSVRLLPQMKYVIWPGASSSVDKTRARQMAINTWFADVFPIKALSRDLGSPKELTVLGRLQGAALMKTITSDVAHIAYVYNADSWWTEGTIPILMYWASLSIDHLVLFPGTVGLTGKLQSLKAGLLQAKALNLWA
jgi:hypothetical protein